MEWVAYCGSAERILGRPVTVKVKGKYILGIVRQYNYKSCNYVVQCEDGKVRKVQRVYILGSESIYFGVNKKGRK